MGHLKATDHAWAAGIIDADGCITLKRRRVRLVTDSRVYYSLFVIVGQSGERMPPMLQRLLDLYGGGIDGPRTRKGKNRLPNRLWYLAHAQAETFLKMILPYLVQKRDQAEVALEFRRVALGKGRTHLQEDFFLRLRSFKHYTLSPKVSKSFA